MTEFGPIVTQLPPDGGRFLGGLCAAGVLAAVACYVLVPWRQAVNAGPFADDPLCSDVVAAAPETLLGKGRDRVDGIGAAAWGDASVVLRCGVEPPAPTTDLCIAVGGVDWVLDEERAEKSGVRVLTTYGRTPAVEVALRDERETAGGVLGALSSSVGDVLQDPESECTSVRDVRLPVPSGGGRSYPP